MGFSECAAVGLDVIATVVKIIISLAYGLYTIIAPKQPRSVANDVVLVTGAAHGIGYELVKQYGELGAQVICVDINENGNKVVADQLTKQNITAFAYTCDVTDRNAVFALADKVRKEVGFVTILVNNAGVMPYKHFLDHTPQEIQKAVSVNVLAQFWMLQAFLPAMISNDYGHVVALSSVAGLMGHGNIAPYCATKFAIRGLMEGLREEMRDMKYNIKFTTVYPFAVETGLCTTVRVGSPLLLNVHTPEGVASAIISAQRTGQSEVSCPFFLHKALSLVNLLPEHTRNLAVDFLNTKVDPQQ